jgi:hypothetical protein
MATSTPTPFYVDVLKRLVRAEVPFVVGGGFAFALYSGVDRVKKDLDIFVREVDAPRALARLSEAGYNTELTFPHWLGKIRCGAHLIDLIFSSGNGIARVDDAWFQHSIAALVLGVPAQLCPPEEMIWSKAFIQERERFDGADVLHLFRSCGPTLDWDRLIKRFGQHWRVLFASIVLFGYVYPSEIDCIPGWVTESLGARFRTDRADPTTSVCRGTLLSRAQYRWDIEQLGYADARMEPVGQLRRDDIAVWDAGIEEVHQP